MEKLRTLEPICGELNKADVSIALVNLKNERDVSHYHPLTQEIYFFMKGNGKININGIEKDITSGDCIVINPNNTHFVYTEEEIIFVCICIPPWNEKCEIRTCESKGKEELLIYKGEKEIFVSKKISIKTKHINEKENKMPNDKANAYCFIGNGKIVVNDKIQKIKTGDCMIVPEDNSIIIEPIEKLDYLFIEANLGDDIKTITITNID